MCDHCGCREFPPIAELTAEHVEILDRAWALAETTRAGQPLPPAEVAVLSRLIATHALKEETGLYPELIERGGLAADQLAELEREHREILEALAEPHFDRRTYYELAAHIEVEEMELFSSAMLRFDEEEWDAMDEAHRAAAAAA